MHSEHRRAEQGDTFASFLIFRFSTAISGCGSRNQTGINGRQPRRATIATSRVVCMVKDIIPKRKAAAPGGRGGDLRESSGTESLLLRLLGAEAAEQAPITGVSSTTRGRARAPASCDLEIVCVVPRTVEIPRELAPVVEKVFHGRGGA